jgi:chromosomal replication initiation ATPase DnaA
MYINADELFKLVGITPTKEAVNLINDRFYIRNKNVQDYSVETIINIITEVAQINGLSFTEVKNNCRKRIVVDTRAESTYVLNLLGFRDCEIRRVFGKDHSTINYYRDRIKDTMSIDSRYKVQFYNKYCHILERFQIANNLNMN